MWKKGWIVLIIGIDLKIKNLNFLRKVGPAGIRVWETVCRLASRLKMTMSDFNIFYKKTELINVTQNEA